MRQLSPGDQDHRQALQILETINLGVREQMEDFHQEALQIIETNH